MSDEHVRVECRDGILRLTLDRPAKLNALTPAMIRALQTGFDRAQDPDVRVVVLCGAGRSFCSGADVELALGLTDASAAYDFLSGLAGVLATISALPKPVIAAIQGHAVGGGAELALEADLRIASVDASLAFPDVAIGSTPASAYQLVRLVGKSLATRMVLLGTQVGAAEMQRLQLVADLVDTTDLQDRALALAAELRDRASSQSLKFGKQAIALADHAERVTDLRANVAAMLACQTSAAQRDWVARFSDHRGLARTDQD